MQIDHDEAGLFVTQGRAEFRLGRLPRFPAIRGSYPCSNGTLGQRFAKLMHDFAATRVESLQLVAKELQNRIVT